MERDKMRKNKLVQNILLGLSLGVWITSLPVVAQAAANELVVENNDALAGLVTANKIISDPGRYYLGSEYNKLTLLGAVDQSSYTFVGGFSTTGAVLGYVVNSSAIVKGIYGGSADNDNADSNQVNILGGQVTGDGVYGGFSARCNTNSNQVNISGGTIEGAVVGGYADLGSSDSNTVNISGGTITGNVAGGYGPLGSTRNTVNISGGLIDGHVWGGSANSGDASNNTVNLLGGTISGMVFGGIGASHVNNTLNVKGLNIKAGKIQAFDNINFYIPSNSTNGDTMLTITGTDATDISGATVKTGVAIQGNSTLAVGDTVNLLYSQNSTIITGADLAGRLTAQEGVSLDYTLAVAKSADSKALQAKVLSMGLKEQTKSLVETKAAGAALLNSGIDAMVEQGIPQATQVAMADSAGAEPFAVMGGSNMKYTTGSYVDMKGWNIGVGFAKTVDNSQGKLTYGPMLNYGTGSYDSYLDEGAHGSGNSHYTGIGMFAHQKTDGGFYYEGSVLVGRTNSDYSSNNMSGAELVTYDSAANYMAGHLGVGQVRTLTDRSSLDMYGKYFYSHQGSSSATLSTGEDYNFDSINSHRIRLGARYNNQVNELSTTYCGLAYEYELGGDARATYKGLETPSPSLHGGSGMLELGYKTKISQTSPVTADISVNGWTGKKQGWSINANLLWEF